MEKPAKKLEVLRKAEAATVYAVRSPVPDSRFETDEVAVNKRSEEIFTVTASKRITPKPVSMEFRLSTDAREAAIARSNQFARSYIASLPQPVQQSLVDEYGTGSWKGNESEHVTLEVLGGDPWVVEIACQDQKRAGAALKEFWRIGASLGLSSGCWE